MVGGHPGCLCDSATQMSMLQFTQKQVTEARVPGKGSHLWQRGDRNSERDTRRFIGLQRED